MRLADLQQFLARFCHTNALINVRQRAFFRLAAILIIASKIDGDDFIAQRFIFLCAVNERRAVTLAVDFIKNLLALKLNAFGNDLHRQTLQIGVVILRANAAEDRRSAGKRTRRIGRRKDRAQAGERRRRAAEGKIRLRDLIVQRNLEPAANIFRYGDDLVLNLIAANNQRQVFRRRLRRFTAERILLLVSAYRLRDLILRINFFGAR